MCKQQAQPSYVNPNDMVNIKFGRHFLKCFCQRETRGAMSNHELFTTIQRSKSRKKY